MSSRSADQRKLRRPQPPSWALRAAQSGNASNIPKVASENRHKSWTGVWLLFHPGESSRFKTMISSSNIDRCCYNGKLLLYAGTLLHPCVPSLESFALRWHLHIHKSRKDQTADDVDVGH